MLIKHSIFTPNWGSPVNPNSSPCPLQRGIAGTHKKNFFQTDNCLKKVFNNNDKQAITTVCAIEYLLYLCRFKSISLSLSLSLSLSNKLHNKPKFNTLKTIKFASKIVFKLCADFVCISMMCV